MSRLSGSLAAAFVVGWAAAALGATPADEQLLAATDLFAAAPSELRLELVFRSGASAAGVPIELWRKGDQLALVRFLAPKDRGKYVVRREGSFWFLAPGAKQPVKLAPALAPSGSSALDDLLSVRPSRDYEIRSVEQVHDQVTFELVLKSAPVNAGSTAPDDASRRPADSAASAITPSDPSRLSSYPSRLKWVVDRVRRLPVRAEFRTADDRVTRLVEFKRWKNAAKLEPAQLVAKDVARGGLPLDVEIVALEARPVDAMLFDLTDGSARAKLPPPVERAVSAKP